MTVTALTNKLKELIRLHFSKKGQVIVFVRDNQINIKQLPKGIRIKRSMPCE